MTQRSIIQLSGSDVRSFLQDLVTNDISGIETGLVYAALLTPQGKYIADFFLSAAGEDVLLDVDADLTPQLTQRLSMYKLRADVSIAPTDLILHRGLGPVPADGFADPRHADLGWRAYRSEEPAADDVDWTALYVDLMVPQSGAELHGDSYVLEMGFERLNGVDFRKGCYVGQEVTARMKHKTELRKGLALVSVDGAANPGAEITADGKSVGTLHTVAQGKALAYLRFDRAGGAMAADGAKLTLLAR